MKKLRLFDSLKFVRAMFVAVVVATFILNVAHADTNAIQSVIAYGKTEQSGTPTPTAPVPIMTNNGVLKASKNLFDETQLLSGGWTLDSSGYYTGTFKKFHASFLNGFTFSQPFKESTQYTLTCNGYVTGNALRFIVTYTDGTSKNWDINKSAAKDYVFVSDAGKTISRIGGSYGSGDYKGFLKDVKVMEGTSADGVYVDGLTETIRDAAGHSATAQMLLGINDTYRDEQNINTGAITRKVGVKVFDGTEDWSIQTNNVYSLKKISVQNPNLPANSTNLLCNYFYVHTQSASAIGQVWIGDNYINFNYDNSNEHLTEFKAWLADQYNAGTPVIVVYPLATETTENVTTQQMTTAPVRQTAGSILGMPIEVVLGDGTREWVRDMVTIATTRYSEEQFEPVETRLDAAVAAVDTVVSQTMSQAQAIDTIATSKQTRPDESCPPFKKCLLVEDEDGTPHWYEIYDPINDFLNPILAAAALSGNQGAPLVRMHACTGTGGEPASGTCYDEYNGFYMGSNVFRQKYYGLDTTYNRPFGPTTLPRCAENAPRTTSTKEAGICYNTGGMFRELTNDSDNYVGEWALVWNGNEGGNSLGITPGVVYGVAKCTSVGQHTTQMTGDVADGSNYWWPKKLNNYSTTLASLITEYPNSNVETVFNTLPNPLTDGENPEYPRANFRNCWCKMTAIGVPGSGDTPDQRYANGSIMSVSGDWIFNHVRTSATDCANTCTYYCAYYFSVIAGYRRTVLTVK